MLVHKLWKDKSYDRIAYRYNGKSVTYGDLSNNVNKMADYLTNIGVEIGENVGLYCKNSIEFIYSYFAIVSIGAVVVPFNNTLIPSEIEYIAKDANMKHILTINDLSISSNFKQLFITEMIEVISAENYTFVPNNTKKHYADDNDVAVIIYTSGTTGFPKGAMLTHKNLCSNAHSVVDAMKITSEDRMICVLPMFHSFAWTTAVLSSLAAGAVSIIIESFNPKEVLRTMEAEKSTMFFGVPAMYTYLLSLGTEKAFEAMRLFVSGGASLPVEIIDSFKKKFGYSITEGYGLSEASPVVSVNPIDLVKYGSIGKTIKDVEVQIIDVDGVRVKSGQYGQLLVKGPNVMKGYYNRPEDTENTIRGNWLHTGDVAYIDEDGYIFIVDRLKDVVIVSGLNVYPREIEEVIYKYEGIIEATVIGMPDEKRGETPIAYVVPNDLNIFEVSGLKEHLSNNLANFKLPRKIVVMESLPKNATGKIMKKTLRELNQ